MIVDRNGTPLEEGQTVRIYQDDQTRVATVHDTFWEEPVPTVNRKGHWIDIKDKDGVEGMMTYLVEVI